MSEKPAQVRTKPLTISAPIVRALLESGEAQHRVVIPDDLVELYEGELIFVHSPDCPSFCDYACAPMTGHCPHPVGSMRWCRETWKPQCVDRAGVHITYRADGRTESTAARFYEGTLKRGWRTPAIMPQVCSRLTVEITDVKVEKQGEQWVWCYTLRRTT